MILQTVGMSTEESQQLQQQDLQQAQQFLNFTTTSLAQDKFYGAMTKIAFFLQITLLIIMIIFFIIGLINIYHWGMTDKAVFEANKRNKKKWFFILIILPVINSLVSIIPLIGWLISFIGFIVWLVLSIQYFFLIRTKLK